MNPLIAKSYVTQLARAIAADGQVGKAELKRLYEVMASLEIHEDTRTEIVNALFYKPQSLLDAPVDEELTDDTDYAISLAKDVLFIEKEENDAATSSIVEQIVSSLGVTGEQLAFLQQWVEWENRALCRLGEGDLDSNDDDQLAQLTSRAASVGIPLSALYFAGSIVGFSAVGVTTGLATIGSASGLILLGLNPMTAGIAALIVSGISIQKLTQFAITRSKKKEIEGALKRAKELQGRYREYLLHDMNIFEDLTLRDWLSGRKNKRKLAIDTYRELLSESLSEDVTR
jgi:hypothetical protein